LREEKSANVTLTRGGGGVFEITVDGKLNYSKKDTGRFPTEQEIFAAIR